MPLFKMFSGPSAEKLEERGDALMAGSRWGDAKLAYERALSKLGRQTGQNLLEQARLAEKIQTAINALVQDHRHNAALYLEGGYHDEAHDLLVLAMDITPDPVVGRQIKEELQRVEKQRLTAQHIEEEKDYYYGLDDDAQDEPEEDDDTGIPDDEYFTALCGPLPDAVREAYVSYGDRFAQGYIALNRGDFQAAADYLQQAMADNPRPDSYIHIELAAACLNLNRMDEAQALLEAFLPHHPEALPAYQLLCDIYWEQKNFERIDTLLASVPDELANSIAVVLLKGESLYQAGRLKAALDLYADFMDAYGWHDAVARELAKIHEALEQWDEARDLYKKMISQCSSCQSRIDPQIKHQYAELSFKAGQCGADILDIYLSLVRELPENAAHYYNRISSIYATQGDTQEAARFQGFSVRAAQKADNK
jgi:tetratricopeptide (TPR) repeat protein